MPITQQHIPNKAHDIRRFYTESASGFAYALHAIAQQSDRLIVMVANHANEAEEIAEALLFYGGLTVHVFPSWETLPYDAFSPPQHIVSQRLRILHGMQSMAGQHVIVTAIDTAITRLAPRRQLLGNTILYAVGQQSSPQLIQKHFIINGYRRVDNVYEPGEFSVRGSLVDIYPMSYQHGIRLDFFDDTIESIRTFDVQTQRTVARVAELQILPTSEAVLNAATMLHFKQQWQTRFAGASRDSYVYQQMQSGTTCQGIEYFLPLLYGPLESLLDYMPEQTLLCIDADAQSSADTFYSDAQRRYAAVNIDAHTAFIPPDELYLRFDDFINDARQYPQIRHYSRATAQTIKLDITELPNIQINAKKEQPLAPIQQLLAQSPTQRCLFVCTSRGRTEIIDELLREHGVQPASIASWDAWQQSHAAIGITHGGLTDGWQTDTMAVITERNLYGQHITSARHQQPATNIEHVVKDIVELREGALVVHLQHGIGKYAGLTTIDHDGIVDEFLLIEYAEGQKLYITVTDLHLISRYAGKNNDAVRLDKLGAQNWKKARDKAFEKAKDVAAQLLSIHARRKAAKGIQFAAPDSDYLAFASAFPFTVTVDQQQSIHAVINDMTSDRKMDRLICGDVGFGKTEVAMRAAFLAAKSNNQIAMLVPTTLLAQQHFNSFRDRFADYPIEIAMASRFNTAEHATIFAKLKNKKIDIVIGTHGLLHKRENFVALGLVIIDEEHRFGVNQKEQLKSLRSEVDILTLTATPIPRTLNMAISGLRDLSIIATPPHNRLPVKTFIHTEDSYILREAVLREIVRGGQVYIVHNRVQSIQLRLEQLCKLLPEAQILVAHGQMPERQLEQTMSRFYQRQCNVLLCTTIIETGIDIANANTIIIERADRFGLAQMHQLRGRVGRSTHQAYCYLFTSSVYTKDAQKRLEALSAANTLGAGFILASHDLEIRGAGELLGDEQSGQIERIGFSMYMSMLEQATQAIQRGEDITIDQQHNSRSNVDLGIGAIFPEDFLPDVNVRLVLYKRIANCQTIDELQAIRVEIIDRFGSLPLTSQWLIRTTKLRIQCQDIGISLIKANTSTVRITFTDTTSVDPALVIQQVQRNPRTFKLTDSNNLQIKGDFQHGENRIRSVEDIVALLLL